MASQLEIDLATSLLSRARAKGLTVATAECCTGGLVAGALTEIAGSSDVFVAGLVTYANTAKAGLLQVPQALLDAHGAVSEPVAIAMAEGALAATGADVAVAITGIAGPGGGSAEKPVGLVHFAVARKDEPTSHKRQKFGALGRTQVRQASVIAALELLRDRL
jgi:nicotinamide-nucleotide amidase